MDRSYYVYEHWRLDKDECFYVGKGRGRRAYSGRRNTHWKNIVAKLDRLGSGYEVRLVATGLSEDEAFRIECERISFWRDLVDLSNLTSGGEGISGFTHSEQTKQKMIISQTGKRASSETKRKLSLSHMGVTQSEASKNKISSTLKEYCASEEVRERLRLAKKGKKLSAESRARISLGRKQYWAKRKALALLEKE